MRMKVAGYEQNVAEASPFQFVVKYAGLLAGGKRCRLHDGEDFARITLGDGVGDGEVGFIDPVKAGWSADESNRGVAVLDQFGTFENALAGPVAGKDDDGIRLDRRLFFNQESAGSTESVRSSENNKDENEKKSEAAAKQRLLVVAVEVTDRLEALEQALDFRFVFGAKKGIPR